MSARKPLVAFFKDIDKHDLPLVGGKGANLGEMANAGFPVPDGFAVTVQAYDDFLEANNLIAYIDEKLKDLDTSDSVQLQDRASQIQRKLSSSEIPEEISREVVKSYKKLSGMFKKTLVAVRSSATAEDLPDASFAGQQATFLNVKGESSLLKNIRDCWASLFTARAIFYRAENKISPTAVKISVIVQKMVQSEVSGVMFTVDPVTEDKERIVIESVWGLGEMIVQGLVVPDSYAVQKGTFSILSKEISDQSIELVRKGNKNIEQEVSKKRRDKQKITDEEIVQLAKIGDKLQKHYYFPQDVEWARQKGKIFITQTRPITTIGSKSGKAGRKQELAQSASADIPILKGAGASPGIVSGVVRVLKSPKEISKIKSGDILVSVMTSPDYVPAMKKAAGIITDQGGQTSHAAIVSRELGIPCVVGTREATSKLKDDTAVTIDGARGMVYLGGNVKIEKGEEKIEKIITSKTATNIYVNLAEASRINEVSKMNVDGVGLLRAEFMIADIGIHPKEAIKLKKQDHFTNSLAEKLSVFCKAFYPRPVIYRATDFKTNEYRALKGGEAWEPEEPNPLMGYRGAFRYVADPEVFTLELRALKKVREKYDNLRLMVPFVRSPEELARVRRLVAAEGLFESPTFKFLMMVELPVNVINLREFIKVGIDGVSIGSNDLTMLLMGTDRDNATVREAFDERSYSVLWSLRRVVRICNSEGISSSICGQAPSDYDDLVEKLVGYGITSISVNADAVNRVRGVVIAAEKKRIGAS